MASLQTAHVYDPVPWKAPGSCRRGIFLKFKLNLTNSVYVCGGQISTLGVFLNCRLPACFWY